MAAEGRWRPAEKRPASEPAGGVRVAVYFFVFAVVGVIAAAALTGVFLAALPTLFAGVEGAPQPPERGEVLSLMRYAAGAAVAAAVPFLPVAMLAAAPVFALVYRGRRRRGVAVPLAASLAAQGAGATACATFAVWINVAHYQRWPPLMLVPFIAACAGLIVTAVLAPRLAAWILRGR